MAEMALHLPVSRVGITRELHRTLLGIALLLAGILLAIALPLWRGPYSIEYGTGPIPFAAAVSMFVLSVLIPAKLGERAGALDVATDRLVVRRGSRVRSIPRHQMVVGWVFDSAYGPRFAIQLTTGEVVSAVVPTLGYAQLVLDQLGLDAGPFDLKLSPASRLRVGNSALELLTGPLSRRIAFSEIHQIDTTFGGLAIVTNTGDRVDVPLVSRRPRSFDFLRTVGDRFLPAPSSAESRVERIEAVAQRIRTAVHRWRGARARAAYRVRADVGSAIGGSARLDVFASGEHDAAMRTTATTRSTSG